jgi:taurine-pyruvate aminotransferase
MPGMSRVYYANSGSEANEKAFKMVRQIAHKRHGGRKNKILYRDRDYHGTTIACLSAGGQDERNAQYGPFTPGFVRVPHCLEYRAHEQDGAPVEKAYGEWAADADRGGDPARGPRHRGRLCLEPVTAGGGVITPRRATGSGCRRSAANTTCCCISTRSSAGWAAPAPGSATSNTACSPTS